MTTCNAMPEQPYYLHHYTTGRHLPASWLIVPNRPPQPAEIRWHLTGWPDYVVDCWNRLWHVPYKTTHHKQRGWQEIRKVVKNGYAGFTMRKNGRPYWMSVRQLRGRLVRNNTKGHT